MRGILYQLTERNRQKEAGIFAQGKAETAFTPDRSTQAYLAQVIEIAQQNAELFSCDDPIDAIHILDDFHSAGRISGSKRIPLAKLSVGESHTIENQRLEVNESLTRYQNELKALALSL